MVRLLVAAALLAAAPMSAWAQAQPAAPAQKPAAGAPQTNPQAEALAGFQERLQKYLELREQMADKLKPLAQTSNAAELTTRQESVAAALRDVRKNAKPGDLIPTRVAGQIRTIVAAYFRGKDAATKRAVFEEVPEHLRPAINKTMPDTAALATVPPGLLNNLPRLPDNLQYRFVGRHIVLLDGDTRLIMDYILNVLPAH
jgi:hypothetical protein